MTVSMRDMLEAGVHFGHQTRFWNPKMAPYIYGHRNKIHIINLEKTQPLFDDAMKFVRQLASRRGTILMIGTKRQAREVIALEAQRCGMPYVDQRWLGGMMTNFKTVKASLKRLKEMQAQKEAGIEQMIKKEGLMFERELAKLEKDIGGIQDMTALPDAMFVIDVGYHKIAVAEAKKLGIPIDRRRRHQPLADRHRLRHSGQRRLGQGRGAVRARRGRRGARRQGERDHRHGAGRLGRRRRVRRGRRERLTGANPALETRGSGPFFTARIPLARLHRRDAGRLKPWRNEMPVITASMVGELRAKTDAPMMECKKALTEADGDMDRAEEILRVKLGSKAGKAASRITAEGVVAASVAGERRRAGRSQLRNRLRLEERRLPGVRQCARRAGRRA